MDRTTPPSLISPQARTTCARLYHVMEVFTDLDPHMRLLLAKVLITVAAEDGLTGVDIAARTNVDPSVTTRHLKALGTHGGGFGLVQFVQGRPGDRRQKHVALTPKGVEMMLDIIVAFKKGSRAKGERMVRAMQADRLKDKSGVPVKTDGDS